MPFSSHGATSGRADQWRTLRQHVHLVVILAVTLWPAISSAQSRLVFDSAQPEHGARDAVEYSWEDGATTFRFGAGMLQVTNRVQFRGTDRRARSTSRARDFDIPRARTEFSGWFVREHLTYEVQFDWAEGPELQDLYVAADVSRTGTFVLKAGQFKLPSSRQRLTSSGELQFVDRSLVADEFTEGRDIGVEVSGNVAGERLEYRAGVFNGAGQNTLSRDGGFQYAGRLTFQPFGTVDYSESDIESAAAPRLAIGGSLQTRAAHEAADAPRRVLLGADALFLYRGMSVLGEVYFRTQGDATSDAGGVELQSRGVLLQGGYFVIPQRLEVAGRLAGWSRTSIGEWDEREVGLAVGYFLNQHNLKLQADVRRVDDARRGDVAHEFRTQLQVVF